MPDVVDTIEMRRLAGYVDASAWADNAPEDELLEIAAAVRERRTVYIRAGDDTSLTAFLARPRLTSSPMEVVEIVDPDMRGWSAGFLAGCREVRPEIFKKG
jgi:hypothetical protein